MTEIRAYEFENQIQSQRLYFLIMLYKEQKSPKKVACLKELGNANVLRQCRIIFNGHRASIEIHEWNIERSQCIKTAHNEGEKE